MRFGASILSRDCFLMSPTSPPVDTWFGCRSGSKFQTFREVSQTLTGGNRRDFRNGSARGLRLRVFSAHLGKVYIAANASWVLLRPPLKKP